MNGRTVEISEDEFIDMLWERVNDFAYSVTDYYNDPLYEACFEYLSEIGWLDPQYNSPKYIVDNIAVNGEICMKEDLPSNYGKTFEELDEDDYLFATDEWVVFNLGL